MTFNSDVDQPLACDLTAIPASAREEHVITASQLFASAEEVRELSNGYAIRFANEPGRFMAIAKFVENERLCCSFFNFGLEIEPDNGPLWLRLTGVTDVKELLQTILFDSIKNTDLLQRLTRAGGDVRFDEQVAETPLPLLKGVPHNDSPN